MSDSSKDPQTAILLVSCPDQPGIVAAVSAFLFENQGNIVDVDQHVDSEYGVFLMRVEWETSGFAVRGMKLARRLPPSLSVSPWIGRSTFLMWFRG